MLFAFKNSRNPRSICYLLFVVALALLPDSNLFAADKWVGSGGSDTNNGNSRAQRWRTLTYALKNLEPGDNLTLLNGRYDIRQEPGHANGVAFLRRTGFRRLDGSPTRYTTIRSESRAGVFVKGNIDILGSYIRIENIRLFGDEGNAEPGFSFKDSHHLDVIGNEIGWCGGGGINFSHCDTIRLIGNRTNNSGLRNFDQHSGISVYQPIPFPDPENRYWKIEIRRNKSTANYNRVAGRYGITDGNGIILDDYYYEQTQFLNDFHRSVIGTNSKYPGRTLIEANICNYNGGTGILCYLTSGIIVKNNTLVGNNQYIFDWNWNFRNRGQIAIMESDTAYVLNNVFQSTYVPFAHETDNMPYVANEIGGGGNYWERNMFHSTVGWNFLWQNSNVANNVFYQDPQLAPDLKSQSGVGQGITWDNHVYEDFYGRRVYGGQRTDLGAIQN